MKYLPRAIGMLILLIVGLLFVFLPGGARELVQAAIRPAARPTPQSAAGSGFSYQGQLKKDGVPISDSCSFTFSLWDEVGSGSPPSGGAQVGGDQTVDDVLVSNGLFTVILNAGGEFGAQAFNGEARWLQTSVTCPNDGGPVTLSPRQPVTPAPYALAALTGPGTSYANLVVVAESGGDFTSIQAAIDSILDAGPDHPYLVWVAPGVYAETVTMKDYVDVQGAGQQATRITATGFGVGTAGTLTTANHSELRDLTVENTGGAAYATAIFINGTAPHLTGITALASGDGNISAAIFSDASASPVIDHAILQARGGGFNHYALYSRGSSILDVRDSTITALEGSLLNYAVLGTVNSTTNLTNSVMWGTTSAVDMLNSTGRIAASQLVGGATTEGTGSLICVGAYDQSFVVLNVVCQ